LSLGACRALGSCLGLAESREAVVIYFSMVYYSRIGVGVQVGGEEAAAASSGMREGVETAAGGPGAGGGQQPASR
jgi:hypothetical protein